MFVEVVRLLITLALTAVGFLAGERLPAMWPDAGIDAAIAPVWGAVIGAGMGYVGGGMTGRRFDRVIGDAPRFVAARPAAELFVGAFGLLIGVIVAAIAAIPMVALLPTPVGWPLAALLVVVAGSSGWRIFGSRSDEVASWAGLESHQHRRTSPGGDRYLIDSSAAIDGRVSELFRSGLLDGVIEVPGFVIDEMQGLADSVDTKVRRRGRRGLDILDVLRRIPGARFGVIDDTVPEVGDVDAKLIELALREESSLVTTDHNLASAAELRGVRVVNPHAIGESLRLPVATGDNLSLTIDKAGSEPGQGVGYLDDGTMVIVSDAAAAVGQTLEVEVSNLVTTAVGRLVFATRA